MRKLSWPPWVRVLLNKKINCKLSSLLSLVVRVRRSPSLGVGLYHPSVRTSKRLQVCPSIHLSIVKADRALLAMPLFKVLLLVTVGDKLATHIPDS